MSCMYVCCGNVGFDNFFSSPFSRCHCFVQLPLRLALMLDFYFCNDDFAAVVFLLFLSVLVMLPLLRFSCCLYVSFL